MGKTLIVTALESELPRSNLNIIYTGVGKVNAAITLTRAILELKPTKIINYGTVGRINPAINGLLEIKTVVQRDMMTMPLAPRGVVPLSSEPSQFHATGTYICGTGDSFVTAHDPWLHEQGVDVVDMELFAIAKTCHAFGLPWQSFKYITDDANGESHNSWEENVHKGATLFLSQQF